MILAADTSRDPRPATDQGSPEPAEETLPAPRR
jgi:hypothetical protein